MSHIDVTSGPAGGNFNYLTYYSTMYLARTCKVTSNYYCQVNLVDLKVQYIPLKCSEGKV